MHYVIYIPGIRGADPQHLARVGLDSLASDKPPEWIECLSSGPDGGFGMVAAWRTGNASKDVSFSLSDKTWTKAPGDGKWWIGEQQPITPDAIARQQPHPGVWVELADGRRWAVPVVNRLPHKYGIDGTGSIVARGVNGFEAFCESAAKHATQLCRFLGEVDRLQAMDPGLLIETEFEVTLPDTWRYCVDALAINYRLNDALVDHLGLLDEAAMIRIVSATIELPAILDVRREKKNRSVFIPVG